MIKNIEYFKFWAGRKAPHYFAPSVCQCNNNLFMILQSFEGASDTFGSPLWTLSKDTGKSWSPPQAIESMKHRYFGNVTEAVAGVSLLYHPQSQSLLAMGCTTYYGKRGHWLYDKTLKNKTFRQFPVYATRNANGAWSERKELKADFFENCLNWRASCMRTLFLPEGEILIAIYFSEANSNSEFKVCSLKCAFDGEFLEVKTVSNVLSLNVGRGLIEPSLTRLNDKYYMTIRAEDEHGYFAVSDDGLNWGELIPWQWDSGKALVMSSTQQHWISNGKQLYLVYTRKNGFNDDIFRWRSPLLMARFDEKRHCLIELSEQEIFPIIRSDGFRNQMGNFHTIDIYPGKSLISTGNLSIKRDDAKIADFYSEILQAEIQWD